MLNSEICLRCGVEAAKERLRTHQESFVLKSWIDEQQKSVTDYESLWCPAIKKFIHLRTKPPENCTYILEQTFQHKVMA
jgi:hypothetical protein